MTSVGAGGSADLLQVRQLQLHRRADPQLRLLDQLGHPDGQAIHLTGI